MELETINRLYLELSQISTAKTERELELERRVEELDGVLSMAVLRLGGKVEGRKTHRGNFLQRIDQLKQLESKK